ncbi:hypothetical protein [Sphingomonas ginsenosidivorax]|uniref:hypothetical protein n=1 Tax=Sphingomonas ginsenosidivorax TaxID=862135 RepID=UPI001F551134|nr:hypothetical protein [Sphingomonas ginsenosidivorax]
MKLRIERIDPGMGLEQFRLIAPHTEPLDAVDLGAVLAGDTLVRDPARLVDVVAGGSARARSTGTLPSTAMCRNGPSPAPTR